MGLERSKSSILKRNYYIVAVLILVLIGSGFMSCGRKEERVSYEASRPLGEAPVGGAPGEPSFAPMPADQPSPPTPQAARPVEKKAAAKKAEKRSEKKEEKAKVVEKLPAGEVKKIEKMAKANGPGASVIDKFLQRLDLGNFVFNCPEKMGLRKPYTVAAVLSATVGPEELEGMIKKYGKAERAEVKISDEMEAHLDGLNFEIRSLTPSRQAITKEGTNEWRWEVKPVERGTQRLHLSLNVFIGNTPHAIRTFERIISVEVTALEVLTGFVENNWQWLIGTLVLPYVGYRVHRSRKKKRGKKDKEKNK